MIDVNKLYLVGPVGAWQDMTLRAREVLCRACLVVAHEEASVRPQLDRMDVHAEVLESGRGDVLERVLSALVEGEVAWLVMSLDELVGPADPLVRALLDRGVELVSVPGASAMVEGLAASGLPADRFTALGVLPTSPMERLALWTRFAHDRLTVVCDVLGGHVGEVLSEILAHLGDRRIAVCQGMGVWRGQASEGVTLDWDGRVTLVIEGAGSEPDWTRERVLDEVRARLDAGTSPRDTARDVAQRSGWSRRQVYELALLSSRDEA